MIRFNPNIKVLLRNHPEYPRNWLQNLPQSLEGCVLWIAQRDALDQDAVLVVSPAERARARHAVMAFAEAVKSRVYYLGIAADTTESELRQRREISPELGSFLVDAAPARAANEGALLLLDGLERAERNVLPTLNNLLENREMSLDDGRIIKPTDKKFRVIAVCSPAPPYKGRPLDPPLRSRLQSFLVPPMNPAELVAMGCSKEIVSAAAAAARLEADDRHRKLLAGLQGDSVFFPISTAALSRLVRRDQTVRLESVYPPLAISDIGDPEVTTAVRAAAAPEGDYRNQQMKPLESIPMNTWFSKKQRAILGDIQNAVRKPGARVLIVGRGGSAKSLAAKIALGDHYKVIEQQTLHEDISSRDLIQRRHVADGKSGWLDAAVVRAARATVPAAALLDGVHRLPTGVLVAALGRGCEDNVLDLPDGTAGLDLSNTTIIALADLGDNKSWLGPDVAAAFQTFVLPEWEKKNDVVNALEVLVPKLDVTRRKLLAQLAVKAMSRKDTLRLSTRALLRLARRLSDNENISVNRALREALMAQYLPSRVRDDLDAWCPIENEEVVDTQLKAVVRSGGVAVIAKEKEVVYLHSRGPATKPHLVPSVASWYAASTASENAVCELARQLATERCVAVVGSQGVGKNVVVDRLLELLDAEREYAQLHRDSTVASVTSSPLVSAGGTVTYTDAPLVRAILNGRVAVLDEVDKAPVSVVAWLKTLVADGVLDLPDGRVLRLDDHPKFKLIVLANRPGFPFHGHGFWKLCGDCFAPLALENPEPDSELSIVQHVSGAALDVSTARRLVAAFSELRALHQAGGLAYPFSLREALSVARHLAAFPEDSPARAVANVLGLDAYSPKLEQIANIFDAHGFPNVADCLDLDPDRSQSLSQERLTIDFIPPEESTPRHAVSNEPKHGEHDPKKAPHVGGNRWAGGSGGTDTAGLGGAGGPYRLWDGQNIPHQVSDEVKATVSEEALAKARELSRVAFERRLEEIDKMSENDHHAYSGVLEKVAAHVVDLREVLRYADRDKSRVWLKRKPDGDVDDGRIVDGFCGDPNVFKKRGLISDNSNTQPPATRRCLLFLMDVSASMYRFQMIDNRLQRALEAALLLMEALDGQEERFDYAIRGHNGDDDSIPLVDFGAPPKSRGERLKILQRMIAHSAHCFAGDTTIQATKKAVREATKHRLTLAAAASDNHDSKRNSKRALVLALSDANFRRYRLDPRDWADALQSAPDDVEGYAVMVGGKREAHVVSAALPPGRGHLALSEEDDHSSLSLIFLRVLRHAGVLDAEEDDGDMD